MTEEVEPITLTILGKEYKIACTQAEHDDLLGSAEQLNHQMREIRESGKVIGTDRIAVMAALNLAHELSQIQKQNTAISSNLTERLIYLRDKIENVLDSR